MPKYEEIIPVVLVDIDEWDPDNGKPHPAVLSKKADDGSLIGEIRNVDGTVTVRRDGQPIRPRDFIVTYPAPEPLKGERQSPPKYLAFEPSEISAFYRVSKPTPVAPKKPALAAENTEK